MGMFYAHIRASLEANCSGLGSPDIAAVAAAAVVATALAATRSPGRGEPCGCWWAVEMCACLAWNCTTASCQLLLFSQIEPQSTAIESVYLHLYFFLNDLDVLAEEGLGRGGARLFSGLMRA